MQKVMVYRNLTKKCWSVKDLRTNRVIMHCDNVYLTHCLFKVSQKGRERVLRERKKYVHAGVRGYLYDPINASEFVQVRYNPYHNESFVDVDGKPVYTADCVALLDTGKVYAQNVA
jgi:hypothetical protein